MVCSGSSGAGRGHGGIGLDLEVAAQRLDRGLDAQLRLGLVELGPLLALPQLAELLLGRGPRLAEPVELRGDGAGGLGLTAATLPQVDDDGLDLGEPALDDRGEGLGGHGPAFHLETAGLGGLPVAGDAGQPLLDLGAAPLDEHAPLPEAAGGHLEIASTVGGLHRTALEVLARLGPGPGPFGQRHLLGLEAGQHLLEVPGAAAVVAEPLVELGRVAGDHLDLGGELHPRGLGPGQRVPGGPEPGRAVVHLPQRGGLGAAGLPRARPARR